MKLGMVMVFLVMFLAGNIAAAAIFMKSFIKPAQRYVYRIDAAQASLRGIPGGETIAQEFAAIKDASWKTATTRYWVIASSIMVAMALIFYVGTGAEDMFIVYMLSYGVRYGIALLCFFIGLALVVGRRYQVAMLDKFLDKVAEENPQSQQVIFMAKTDLGFQAVGDDVTSLPRMAVIASIVVGVSYIVYLFAVTDKVINNSGFFI